MAVYDDEKTDRGQRHSGQSKPEGGFRPRSVPGSNESGSRERGHVRRPSTGREAHGETTRPGHENPEATTPTAATPEQSRAESKEKEGLKDQLGKGFTDRSSKKGLAQRRQNAKNMRNILAALGISSAIIGLIVTLIFTLLPFKLTHILESIEQRVGEVPQYAMEQRLEFYVSRYLMIRSLEATGQFDFSPGGADRGRFTYLGDSFWDSMYTNWRGANLEAKLAQNHNIKLAASRDPSFFRGGTKLRATDFHLIDLDDDSESIQPLNRTEARRVIKDFARDETRSHQVFKRWNMRRVLYKYYGVGKWKPFERTRDRVGGVYREKKLAFKRRLVNETVGRLSERYDKYLTCLLEADGRECRDLLKKADTDLYDPNSSEDEDRDNDNNGTPDREENGTGDADVGDNLDELADAVDGDSNNRLTKRIMSKLREFGLKKIIGSLAAGIGIIDTLSHIYDTVDSGVINQVIYDKNAQQYMAFAAPILSAAHQIQAQGLPSIPGSNDFDIEDARVAHEIIGDFDNSPVYQSAIAGQFVGQVAGQRIWRDCNDDPDDGKETQLAAGETVCPNKKLMVDRTQFTESAGWEAAGAILRPYRDTVGSIIGAITGVVDGLADLVGINALITNLADKLGITDLAMRGFSFLLNWFAGPVVTGAEIDEEAFDAVYASVAAASGAMGGDAGANKEDTIGGAYLTEAQAGTVKRAMLDDHQRRLEQKPFFARYFSPHIKESLAGRLAMAMPVTLTGFSQQVASVFTQPLSFVGSFAGVLTGSTKALTPDSNPFDALQMGYPADHPVLTANNGEGMDPDELQETYDCDLPPEDRPQNSGDDALGRGPDNLPFEVPLEQDPCQLEVQTGETGVNYFTGKLGAGDFEPLSGGEATGGGGGPIAPGGPCPAPEEHMGENALTVNDMTVVAVGDTSITVNPCIAPIVQRLLEQAAADGINLRGSNGYRDPQTQIALRRAHCGTSHYAIWEMPAGQCSPPTARPGHSNHEVGAAIDFQCNGGSFTEGGPCWNWMVSHNGFGLINLDSEPWHWSSDGS